MTQLRQRARLLGAAAALCALVAAPAAHAQQVTLAPVTLSGGLYHYDYTITDDTPTEFVDIALNVMPGVGTILNPNAPAGFQATYTDSNLGIVDFTAGTNALGGFQDFTPGSTFSGFTFDSPVAPQPSAFIAYDTSLSETTGPAFAPAVPEPGTLALALLAAPGLALIAARRRRGV